MAGRVQLCRFVPHEHIDTQVLQTSQYILHTAYENYSCLDLAFENTFSRRARAEPERLNAAAQLTILLFA